MNHYNFNVTGPTKETVKAAVWDELDAAFEIDPAFGLSRVAVAAAVDAHVDIVGEAEGAELSVSVTVGVGAEDDQAHAAALQVSVSRFTS